MTTQEFSDEFDVLYNNITSNQAPGLDEYEKSIFLTKAQNEIIKNYFNPKGNKYLEGFDGSPKRQIDFSKLLKVKQINEYTPGTSGGETNEIVTFDDRSKLFEMPSDMMISLNETCFNSTDLNGENGRYITIIPISFDEYARIMSKPYKQPLKNQGWRLFNRADETIFIDGSLEKTLSVAEVIVKKGTFISNYKVRYVKRPQPIVLTILTGLGVSIDGEKNVTDCELDSILHPEILQRAVELAKAAYSGDINSTVELGKRSE